MGIVQVCFDTHLTDFWDMHAFSQSGDSFLVPRSLCSIFTYLAAFETSSGSSHRVARALVFRRVCRMLSPLAA